MAYCTKERRNIYAYCELTFLKSSKNGEKTGGFATMVSFQMLETLRHIANSQDTLDLARLKNGAFTRNRSMPFPDAVSFLLDMRTTTLQTRLNLFFANLKDGEPISQQAFSKLRMNFDHSPFETMVHETVKEEYSGSYELPLWHGYHLFGIDGSFLQLPRVDELRREYGTRGRGSTCPCAGISVLYDVLHGWAVDPIISKADRSERAECEKHIEFLIRELPHIAVKSILLMDRGYPSLGLLGKLCKSGLFFLARCNSQFLTEINNAPMGDSNVLLKNGVTVRVFKFELSTGEIETLVTNLFGLPASLLPELYALRWGSESAYFRLKQELCVEKFSGKTPNSIRQDFWASMVMMNTVAVFQREADIAVRERQKDKPVKHVNRARTSDLIITLRDRFIFAVLCGYPELTDWEMEDVLKTLARSVSPVRPGRSFPRDFKPVYAANHNLKSHL
jgi:hypothetical protein